MPSLYSTGTNTTYTVTASNVIGLYQVSTSTAVITATTYSTNLVGLYGGSYSALPTNAAQLIQLFDNNGNVNFYLDPATNSSTIFANFIGTASISIGNFQLAGNTITNTVNGPINLLTNGNKWIFNTNGSTTFPYYTFPATTGSYGQTLTWPVSGSTLAWTTITSASTATTVNSITAGTGISVSTSTGSVVISNTGVLNLTAGTGTYISTSTGNITIWTAPALSTAYDFGTILAPVSYTLDMGPII